MFCVLDEGHVGAGATAESRRDRAPSDAAADAGKRTGSPVTGRGKTG